jgi:hypothetical protein
MLLGAVPWRAAAAQQSADSSWLTRRRAERERRTRQEQAWLDGFLADTRSPAFYTRIVEVHGRNRERVIATPTGEHRPCSHADSILARRGSDTSTALRRGRKETVNSEADVAARIRISFDRQYITDCQISGLVGIRAWAQSPSATRELEVRGYSEVGKERKPSPARTMAGVRADRLAEQAANVLGTLEAIIQQQVGSVQDSLARVQRPDTAPAVRELISLTRLQHDLDRRLQTLNSKRLQEPGVTTVASDTLELARLQLERDTTAHAVDRTRLAIAALQKPLKDSIEERRKLVAAIAVHAVVMRPLLERLLEEDGVALEHVALLSGRDPKVLQVEVRDLVRDYLPAVLSGKSEHPEIASASLETRALYLKTAAHTLAEAFRSAKERVAKDGGAYHRIAVADLRDTEILLAAQDVHNGDLLTIQVSDSNPVSTAKRVFEVRVRVQDLGWSRGVSDAALLLNRRGVTARSTRTQVNAAKEAFAAGQVDPVDVPLPANFVPAAGANLVWTYRERHRRTALHHLLRWITPGVGINVSFTNFSSQTVSPTGDNESDATDMQSARASARQQADDTKPEPVVTPAKAEVQVAAGPVLTLFDNRLLVSTGWNLNVEERRRYVAIGFSFVNIAKRFGLSMGDAVP